MLRNDRSSSSPKVGRDLGRSSHPGLTKVQQSDECSDDGILIAFLVLPLLLVLLVWVLSLVCRKVLEKFDEVRGSEYWRLLSTSASQHSTSLRPLTVLSSSSPPAISGNPWKTSTPTPYAPGTLPMALTMSPA